VTGGIWADQAPDVPIGGEPTPGVTYANSNMVESEIQAAWAFKTVVDSANANEVLRRLTTLTQMMETKGGLAYCASTNYEEGAFCIGGNNSLYIALSANIGNDPISDSIHWKLYSSIYLPAAGTAVNSSKLSGFAAGNATGNIPISNGTICTNLNAELLNGHPQSYYQPVPAGTVLYVAQQVAPSGYLAADGAQVDRELYAELFSAIGTVFGSGNGGTTFNVPDLRGQFVRGWDTGGGIDPGRTFGSEQTDDIVSHAHQIYASNWQTSGGSGGMGYSAHERAWGSTESEGGTETRPINVALLAVIKY
jgi:microcystin-dependent protein